MHLPIRNKSKLYIHVVNILEQVNYGNLVAVIDVAAPNASIDQILTQWGHNYVSMSAKPVQKRSMRQFYYKSDSIDCQKYRALLKMHTYLM